MKGETLMVQVRGLVKTFDNVKALNGLDINIQKGSIYGLVGVNGSGKTTVINLLSGVYRQDAGEVLIDGAPVYDSEAVKRRVRLIPDELFFFPMYNMKRTRLFYKGIYEAWDDERYYRLVEMFKLNEKRHIGRFSKGMQKQAAFAFALASTPDVLLLDEPIDGLDPVVRKLVMKEIIDDVARRQMTVLISSHNLKEMDGICDAIGIIKDGVMITERDLDDMKSDVHKIQLVLPEETKHLTPAGVEILHRERQGSMELWVVRGNEADLREAVSTLRPLVYDHLPLTLEEIFIYETEGAYNEEQPID
jgi:ABC-2 type transport system ATP-binding protein